LIFPEFSGMRKLHIYLLQKIVDLVDLETAINLYKANIISEKLLLAKLGYRDSLEMYLALQEEIKETHNMCPYQCYICDYEKDLYECVCCKLTICSYHQLPCDKCMCSICETCLDSSKECLKCHRFLCADCMIDHKCVISIT